MSAPLSLPERIVHAIETTIEERADVIRISPTGAVEVEGMLVDFAKYGAASVIEVIASEYDGDDGKYTAKAYRDLAQSVLDVPAVKAV